MKTNRTKVQRCGPRVLAAAAGLAIGAGVGAAQDRTWNGGTGNWSVANNWTPADVPDTAGENALISAAGSYTVSVNGGYSIGGLSLTNPAGLLSIPSGNSLGLAGNVLNNSTITVNSTGGASGTYIQAYGSQTWSGTGAVVLNANSAGNLSTAYLTWYSGGERITQNAGHSVRGTGRISVTFTNNGTINADAAARVLLLADTAKVNNALATATNGGYLDISTTVAQGVDGRIVADGGTVRFSGATINTGQLSAVGTGLLSVTGTSLWNGTTLSGPAQVQNSATLQLADRLINNGLLTVNRTGGASTTALQCISSLTLDGTGAVVLNANTGGNLDTAYITWYSGGELLTQAAAHTIRGSGRVYVSMTNNGVVNADVNGRVLLLGNNAKSNTNLLTATGGGILELGTTINQSGAGRIVADSATVRMNGAAVNQGQITAIGTGAVQITGTSSWNGVTLTGPARIGNSTTLQIVSELINNGTVTVNDTGGASATTLQFLNSTALNGAGAIILNANTGGNLDTANLIWFSGTEVVTQSATHTIRGTGRISVGMVNNGTISADLPGKVLKLCCTTKVNHGLVRAINGGTLEAESVNIVQSAGGVLRAEDASSLRFNSATVSGGLITTTGTGIAQILGDTRYYGVQASGSHVVADGQRLHLADGLTNDGVITINQTGGASATFLQVLNSMNLSGSGSIVLNANPAGNLNTAYLMYYSGGEVLTQAAAHTIRGTGRIYLNLANNGTVAADVPGMILDLTDYGKTNNSVMKAVNGATLSLTNMAMTQAPGGDLLAENESLLMVANSTISGGLIRSVGSGLVRIGAGSRFNSVTTDGEVAVDNGGTLQLAGTLTNHGVLTVNGTAGASGTFVVLLSSVAVGGEGELRLNANAAANLDAAYMTFYSGGELLTNGRDHSLTGRGRLYVNTRNNGTISPGSPASPIGQIDLRSYANLSFGPEAEFICQIADTGDTHADRITGDRVITLDGKLRVEPVASYEPKRGDAWTIISGASVSGQFAEVETPRAINGIGYRVTYQPTRVVVDTICYADVNEDGGIDGSDVEAFFTIWEAGSPVADINSDGGVDGADVEFFFAYWEAGGC